MAELAGLPIPYIDWSSSEALQALRKFKNLCDERSELASTWTLSTNEKKLSTYWTKFEDLVAPRKCKYTNHDEHIIDALIFQSNNPRVQSNLLEHDDTLTLDKPVNIARTQQNQTLGLHQQITTALTQLYSHSLYINSVSENDPLALLQLQVDSGQVTEPLLCKIDTGAEGNIITVDTFKPLCPQSRYSSDGTPLGPTPSGTTIYAFGGHITPHFGTCDLILSHHGHSKSCALHVVNTEGPTTLGLPTCSDMKLVTLNYDQSCTYARLAGEYRCEVRNSLPTSRLLPRNWFHQVPEALREPLKTELDALIEQGIIAKVDEPTDWVNSLVCVTKSNGILQLCVDPKDLNHAIKGPHHCT
ncbi:hypothetical protein P5673_026767 [Acropora cervicornis]|uniref:Peptidase A2 domain-containing protein n=1 Tax=Acropora cervicornis TaxID=6130 RepID=A0AAD9Q007_ACRCE|nr:hypothetical protein P5673_026767 [Acropora cervicornis]